MKRAKPPKKNKELTPKMPTHFIMSVIMPCVMLACKDKYKATQSDLDDLSQRINRYIEYIADGKVTLSQLHEMMEVRDEKHRKNG